MVGAPLRSIFPCKIELLPQAEGRIIALTDEQSNALLRAAIANEDPYCWEHADGRFFDPLIPMFDTDGGVVHGLFHYHRKSHPCYCPGCYSRNARDAKGRVESV